MRLKPGAIRYVWSNLTASSYLSVVASYIGIPRLRYDKFAFLLKVLATDPLFQWAYVLKVPPQ